MQINKTKTFDDIYKKLHQNQKKELEDAIRVVSNNPLIGERKVGDINGVRVYKTKIINQLTLIAYYYNKDKNEIILLFLGSHQNFYNQLKKII